MARLALAFLGPLQVTLDGAPITTFESDKVRALLAYLAVEADRPHRRATLAGLLWPERSERAAHLNLNQALSNLRQALGDRTAGRPVLQITRESIQFDPDGDALDVAMFAALLAACDQHPHRHPETCPSCLRRLQQAVELYRGDFLAQFFLSDSTAFDEWVLLTRERLRRRALGALARLATAYERRGEYAQVQRYAWRQLELEPWREVAHRQAMRGLARGGQRNAALEHYERCRRVLAAELGVEPEPETTALHARLQRGEQLEPQSVATPATNLPAHAPRTPFLGREGELAQVADRIEHRDCRLLTLVGLGGSGKTRLALQAAADHRVSFADGVYFVPLAPLGSPELLVPAIADALGFVFHGAGDRTAQLHAYLREKEMLLVLDNFEHLLDGADLLAELVRRAPAVRWLVTSRERLNLQVEWVLDIGGLPVPHGADAEEVAVSSAVQLFVQTARRVNAAFALSPETMPSAVRICRWVDGMPLAIELAASWGWAHSCAEIAQELEGSLDVLATELRDVPARHRSMRAVFDHSWKLLSAEEQRGLAASAVFRGGFTCAAAEQVAGASGPLLSRLLAKSLLQRDAAGRYDLHELVRQYALEQLQAAGELDQVRERHLQYFLALAEAAEAADAGLITAESSSWVERLEVEHDNLRAALAWGVQGGPHPDAPLLDGSAPGELGLRLCFALYEFWQRRGYARELRQGLAAALASTAGGDPAPRPLRLRALRLAGELAREAGDREQMQVLYQEELGLARALGDTQDAAEALIRLAFLADDQGDRHGSARLLDESLALFQAIGAAAWGIGPLCYFVLVGRQLGDYPRAVALLEESLAHFQRVNDRPGIAEALATLGTTTRDQGDYGRSEAYLLESLALFRDLGDMQRVAGLLHGLGETVLLQQQYARAYALAEESVVLFRALGDPLWAAMPLVNLGHIAKQRGDMVQAIAHFSESLTIHHDAGKVPGVAACLAGLAGVAARQGQPARAARLFGAAARQGAWYPPAHRIERDRDVAMARSGIDPISWEAAWAAGQAMTLEQVTAYALAVTGSEQAAA